VRGGVLVHCQMGVSRSASSVLAFLLWAFRGLTLDEAMRHTVSRRDCVCPNEGFLHKLKSFESHVRAQDARDA
jgi:atypical dual specificity phosphatase